MKKIILFAIISFAALAAGCERFDEPEAYVPVTDADITADGYTFMSITDFKQQYYYATYPTPGSTVAGVKITNKVALKGKVISSDESGNIYRSLYIQQVDSENRLTTGAIEIKVGKSAMYNTYKYGQIVYIKADGLVLGNYRNMLSLGGASVGDDAAKYSNGYIDVASTVNAKVLRGAYAGITDSEVFTVTSSNVATVFANNKPYLGCLIQFNGLTSHWGDDVKVGGYSDSYYPSYYDSDKVIYNAQYDEGKETWAYSKYDSSTKKSYSYYGSALFLCGSTSYPFVVRTSGYSKFALEPVPANGKTVNIRAIMGIYSSTYQLTLNAISNVTVL